VSYSEAVKSELKYIELNDLGSKDIADTVCHLVALSNQCFHCYSSSGRLHAMHLVRHLAGMCSYYFYRNRFAVSVKPQNRRGSFGQWLFAIDGQVQGARRAITEGSEGDTKSYLMNILGACAGCADEFNMEPRLGYEEESTPDKENNGS